MSEREKMPDIDAIKARTVDGMMTRRDIHALIDALTETRTQLAAAEEHAKSLELQNHIITEVNRRFDVAWSELRTRAERAEGLLDFLADNPPFDEFHGIDIYETWGEVATQHGREEANDNDKREAFRVLLERARDGQGAG